MKSDIRAKIIVIIAVDEQSEFLEKIACLKEIADALHVKLILPEYNRAEPNFDFSKAINALNACDFVLADLTRERPSCYYELGLAEALGRPTGIIAKIGTRIHQTSLRSSILYYESMQQYKTIVADLIARILIDARSD